MKSLRLHAIGDLRLHDEPDPIAGAGEALVRVSAVGVCGSDIHWFTKSGIGDARLTHPLVLGHEFAGVIASGPRAGQRVAVDPAIACGRCQFCLQGNPNFCEAMRFAGHAENDGALCELVAWPEKNLIPLPPALSDADGAMLEPLGVALFATDLAHLKAGMTVGVFGCGPIGLLVVQLARVMGATAIVATDALPHRVEVARSFGATAILSQDGREAAQVMDILRTRPTGECGVDVAFEVAGENAAVETAVTAARPGGKVILVGIPAKDETTFTASTARRKGLTIKLVRRMKHTYPRAIRLVESGLVDVRSLVTHHFPLARAVEAFTLANQREGLKVIIDVGK